MIVQQGLAALDELPPRATVSIGNFDGVHLGHQAILRTALAAKEAGPLAVVTFEPHPLTVLRPAAAPPRLQSEQAKRDALAACGVDQLIELPPVPDVLELSADAFYRRLLARDVATIVEGVDFNFGKARSGNIETLKTWCERDGVRLTIVPDETVQLDDRSTAPISSSLVRWLIGRGRVGEAGRCLGRPVRVEGVVIHGEKRGRTIGFPTANVEVADDAIFPADGVYAARVSIGDRSFAVALSIGTKPTFHANAGVAIEAYLIDFTGDLYGQTLALDVLAWLRPQQKYPSLETLVAQLDKDVAACRTIAGDYTRADASR